LIEFKSLKESESDWLQLEMESKILIPFSTYAWAISCVKYHPQVKTEESAILIKDNKPIALLPIFYPKNKGDYYDVLIDKEYSNDYDVVEFVDEVCKSKGLYPFPVSDGVINDFFTTNFVCEEHRKSALCADISSGYDEYFDSLDKSLKYDIRRLLRKLNRDIGQTEFNFELFDRDINEEVDKFVKLNSMRWGNRARTMRNFFKSLANLLKDNVWLCFLRINGLDLYSCWIYIFGDTAYYYMGGFNVEFKKFMPGFVLLDAIINKCCENNINTFDFLKGESNYKKRLGGIEKKRYRITGRKI
jgi:CelD/BcsL family acetyltransferase involved in cellulose biosynthesis